MLLATGIRTKSQAFSLVELSIVLVIIGLLAGGVLAGQSLIRAAELRGVTTEYEKYIAATQAFRDHYMGFPGDITNATAFWGRMNGNPDCVTNSAAPVNATGGGACDGNGDGVSNVAPAVSTSGEIFQFWRELALSGIIEGSYTGISGPTAGTLGSDTIPGTNAPASKVGNAGWGADYLGNFVGDPATYKYNYGNTFDFGATDAGNEPIGPALRPEEAWNIDTKIDDGNPGSGKVLPRDFPGFGNANGCTTSANNTDYSGSYNLSNSALSCSLLFINSY